jgi:hypothetical protein
MEHVYNRFMQLATSEILDELFVEYIFFPTFIPLLLSERSIAYEDITHIFQLFVHSTQMQEPHIHQLQRVQQNLRIA